MESLLRITGAKRKSKKKTKPQREDYEETLPYEDYYDKLHSYGGKTTNYEKEDMGERRVADDMDHATGFNVKPQDTTHSEHGNISKRHDRDDYENLRLKAKQVRDEKTIEGEMLHDETTRDEQRNDNSRHDTDDCENVIMTRQQDYQESNDDYLQPVASTEKLTSAEKMNSTRDHAGEDYDYVEPISMSQLSTNHLMVASIDLGTVASGYAFSFRNDYQTNPLLISTHTWSSTTSALSTLKTPTCILFNPEGVFDSFGYEAQNRYSNLLTDEEFGYEDWLFFQNFKMILYENKELTFRTKIQAENSRYMPAITVFSESIRFLKNHLLERCCSMKVGLREDDVYWTITVPAIWNDSAKLFMRRAAELTGIPRTRLLLALEPEAGAIYCKYQPIEVQRSGSVEMIETFKPGSCYMVVDAGGGTVDITVHSVENKRHIKEVYAANGGPWGGNFVNIAFLELLREIFGHEVFEDFRWNCDEDNIDMMREFEVKKQTTTLDDSCMRIRIPPSLVQTFNRQNKYRDIDLSSHILTLENKFNDGVEMKRDRLILKKGVIQNIFSTTVDAITNHIEGIMQQNLDITTILMIGGFSESLILQNAIRRRFKTQNVIVPNDPSLSVLKGAVIFGHDQGIVSSRVLKCTYGIECSNNFIEGVHDPSKMYLSSLGVKKCGDIFGIIAKMGDSVSVDCASKERCLVIDETNINVTKIYLYVSTISSLPKYITDIGCRKIGRIAIPLSGSKTDTCRKIYFSLKFGETEIKVLYRQDENHEHREILLDLLGENCK